MLLPTGHLVEVPNHCKKVRCATFSKHAVHRRLLSRLVAGGMVFVADWGSVFDAPVDVVWKYLQSDTDHGNSHKGRRNFERKALTENTVMLSWEQDVDGKWIRLSNRLTFHPPVGFFVEPIEGPMAGSKFFNYYVPKGDKTEVVVVGDWNSKTIPPAQLEKAVMANLEKIFQEDAVGLKEFSRKG